MKVGSSTDLDAGQDRSSALDPHQDDRGINSPIRSSEIGEYGDLVLPLESVSCREKRTWKHHLEPDLPIDRFGNWALFFLQQQ